MFNDVKQIFALRMFDLVLLAFGDL